MGKPSATKLKYNPFKLYQVKGNPKWLKAIQLHPPAPKPIRGVIPSLVGMFPTNSELPIFTAPEIKYKEDETRDLFYQQHPFELHRPRVLSEDEVVWDSIHGTPEVPLSGESVVQHTMYLSERMSLDEAYQTALSKFYEARQKQETQEYQARKKRIQELRVQLVEEHKQEHLRKIKDGEIPEDTPLSDLPVDPLFGMPFSSRFMELERMELQQGIEYKKSLLQLE